MGSLFPEIETQEPWTDNHEKKQTPDEAPVMEEREKIRLLFQAPPE
jgi:hypothetical protein